MVKIIHLEDEERARNIFEIVRNSVAPDAELLQFDNSNDALEYIEANANDINLMVLDVRVPGIYDGLQLAQHVRVLNRRCRIVISSAYTQPEGRVLRDYDLQWLPKPVDVEQYREILANVL